jgi:hypothetical protein
VANFIADRHHFDNPVYSSGYPPPGSNLAAPRTGSRTGSNAPMLPPNSVLLTSRSGNLNNTNRVINRFSPTSGSAATISLSGGKNVNSERERLGNEAQIRYIIEEDDEDDSMSETRGEMRLSFFCFSSLLFTAKSDGLPTRINYLLSRAFAQE